MLFLSSRASPMHLATPGHFGVMNPYALI